MRVQLGRNEDAPRTLGSETHLHVLRRTSEPHDADVDASTLAADEWVLQEMAATALHFAYYNFCRVHQTLRVTPAMEARLTGQVWRLDELIALLDRRSAEAP